MSRQIGIFCTRWNVAIGGQLFSKSFRGLTVYKLQMLGLDSEPLEAANGATLHNTRTDHPTTAQ